MALQALCLQQLFNVLTSYLFFLTYSHIKDTIPISEPQITYGEIMSAKILVVEDNVDSCAYLARLLELKGYTVATAKDGMEALHEIEKYNPDLIVSDIMTPRVDGIQMLRALRSIPKYKNIPVLMISAFGSGNLQEALKAGANEAMRKPLDFDKFFSSLTELLH